MTLNLKTTADLNSRNKKDAKRLLLEYVSVAFLFVILIGPLIWKNINFFSALSITSASAKTSSVRANNPKAKVVAVKVPIGISIAGNNLPSVSNLVPETIRDSREPWKFHIFVDRITGERVAVRKRGRKYDGFIQFADEIPRGNVNKETINESDLPAEFKKRSYEQLKDDAGLSALQDYIYQVNNHFHCFK